GRARRFPRLDSTPGRIDRLDSADGIAQANHEQPSFGATHGRGAQACSHRSLEDLAQGDISRPANTAGVVIAWNDQNSGASFRACGSGMFSRVKKIAAANAPFA